MGIVQGKISSGKLAKLQKSQAPLQLLMFSRILLA